MPIVVEGEVEEDAFVGFLDLTIGIGEGAGEGAEVALIGPGFEIVVGNPNGERVAPGRAAMFGVGVFYLIAGIVEEGYPAVLQFEEAELAGWVGNVGFDVVGPAASSIGGLGSEEAAFFTAAEHDEGLITQFDDIDFGPALRALHGSSLFPGAILSASDQDPVDL